MAEGPADEQHGGSVDKEQDVLIEQEPRSTHRLRNLEYLDLWQEQSALIPNSQSSSGEAGLIPGSKKQPGYYSENGYLMELSMEERQRIQEEINQRYKPGELLHFYRPRRSWRISYIICIHDPRSNTVYWY